MITVIGRGHSGTRILSHTLQASGVFMGKRLNHPGDKLPAQPLYDACKIMSKYVKWNGELSWDFSWLYTMEIPKSFEEQVYKYLDDVLKVKSLSKGWKLPETTLVYPWIVRMFPDIKYIHWIRDPRDCILSSHNTDDLRNFGIEYSNTEDIRKRRAISWYYQYQLVKSAPKPKNYILIRFEDFILKQEETLKKLEEFLEIPLGRIIVRKDSVGRWKKDEQINYFYFFEEAITENNYGLHSSQDLRNGTNCSGNSSNEKRGLVDYYQKTEGGISLKEFKFLYELAKKVTEHSIVEVGSYRGRSTVALGRGSIDGSKVPVFAIEPHEAFRGILGGKFGPQDRGVFYSAMLDTDCYNVVRLINLSSENVAPLWQTKVALLWIDGDHSYQGVKRDFEYWEKHLVNSGSVVFDDSLNPNIGPYQLIEELISQGKLEKVNLVGKVTHLRFNLI